MAKLRLLLCFVLLPFAGPARAQPAADEPPVAGRPEDFSEVVGFYQISSTAAPGEVAVEDPVVLTVRISGTGPHSYQPERRKLRLFGPELHKDFYVEASADSDRHLPKENAWLFVYRLRPKRPDVNEIPRLRLVYYSPARKRFQTTYSEAIRLVVKPRPVVETPAEVVKNSPLPASFYKLVTGPTVLRHEERPGLPYPLFLLLALVPPAVCAAWYLRWCSLHPDDARVAHQRRSRAAQLALNALEHENQVGAERIFAIVMEYVQNRTDISVAEPTAAEVDRRLLRLGITPRTRRRIVEFFAECDAARFAPPDQRDIGDLAAHAVNLIQGMEADGDQRRGSGAKRPLAGAGAAAVLISLTLLGRISAQKLAKQAMPAQQELLGKAESTFLAAQKAGDNPAKTRAAFAQAADLYDALRRQGVRNADLYRNLGNAHFLAGHLAQAISAYRAGLRLDPQDRVLQENLDHARARVQFPPDSGPPESAWLTSIPSPFLQAIVLFTLVLASVLWTRRAITGKGAWRAVLATSATLFASGALIWTEWQGLQEERYPMVVIATDGTALYRGNGVSYPRHPTLPALAQGMEARRLVKRGDWLQIELADGQIGWIRASRAVSF